MLFKNKKQENNESIKYCAGCVELQFYSIKYDKTLTYKVNFDDAPEDVFIQNIEWLKEHVSEKAVFVWRNIAIDLSEMTTVIIHKCDNFKIDYKDENK